MSIVIGCSTCGRRGESGCEVKEPCNKFNHYKQWMPCASEEKEKENNMIYAHIGHPDPVGKPGEPGVPSIGCAAWTGIDMDPWVATDPNKSVTSDHTIIAESSTITQRCELGKPDLELKVERKTMLGTDDMHITSETIPAPRILDSGNRRQFESGAVRDIQEGKGRMDLLPWAAIMEVSKHCENGAKKYGEHNVDKGIPTHSLCDSAARHLAKYLDGWNDEPHLLAAAWNLLWAVQMELKHKECIDTPWMKKEDDITNTSQE